MMNRYEGKSLVLALNHHQYTVSYSALIASCVFHKVSIWAKLWAQNSKWKFSRIQRETEVMRKVFESSDSSVLCIKTTGKTEKGGVFLFFLVFSFYWRSRLLNGLQMLNRMLLNRSTLEDLFILPWRPMHISEATQCWANGILTSPCKVWITAYFTPPGSQSLSLTNLSPYIWPEVRKQGERK